MPNVQALLFGGVIGVRVAMKEELRIMSETKQNFYSWGSVSGSIELAEVFTVYIIIYG